MHVLDHHQGRVTDPTPTNSAADTNLPKTVTRPANEDETREVITALLSLGQDQVDNTTEASAEPTETETENSPGHNRPHQPPDRSQRNYQQPTRL